EPTRYPGDLGGCAEHGVDVDADGDTAGSGQNQICDVELAHHRGNERSLTARSGDDELAVSGGGRHRGDREVATPTHRDQLPRVVRRHLRTPRVVYVDHSGAHLVVGEETLFGPPVGGHVTVEVEMVLGDVGVGGDREPGPVDTPQLEGMGGDF